VVTETVWIESRLKQLSISRPYIRAIEYGTVCVGHGPQAPHSAAIDIGPIRYAVGWGPSRRSTKYVDFVSNFRL
jgi:hypothetical protein